MEKKELTYTKDSEFDFVIEENNNTFIALRKIGWNGREPKLDLRKWYSSADGSEVMGKGISFTDTGANELVKVLVENKYGDTTEILDGVKNRDDFRSSLNKILDKDDPHYDENVKDEEVYYDPRTSLFGDEEEE